MGKLHDALAAVDRVAWVDWEGIPASAKWMAEVRAAIDETDAFCFVISPDSIESPVCREEAAHAAAMNKRILPVLHRPVPDGLVPETVAAHNWIDFTDQRGFDQAFETLVRAISTDPTHVRAHTRYLVRAKGWDEAARDRAKLLRGSELDEAEAWFASAEHADPRPTRLHSAYLLASRRAASRRQRTGIVAVVSVLIVSLVLSSLAVMQSREAARQRDSALEARAEAEAALAQSRSRELALASGTAIPTDPELALLLAIESAGAAQTTQSEQALRDALNASKVRVAYRREGEALRVAIDPSGKWAVGGWDDGTVVLVDAETGTPVHEWASDQRFPVQYVGIGEGIVIAQRSDRRYLWAKRGTTAVWDIETGEELITAPHMLRQTPGISGDDLFDWAPDLSADGKYLVTVVGHQATAWDVRTGEEVATIRHGDDILGVDIDPAGNRFASASADGTVGVWSLPEGRPVARLEPPWAGSQRERPWVNAVAFSPDGRWLATGGYAIDVYETGTWKRTRSETDGIVSFVDFAGSDPGSTEADVGELVFADSNTLHRLVYQAERGTWKDYGAEADWALGVHPDSDPVHPLYVVEDEVRVSDTWGELFRLLQQEWITEASAARGAPVIVTGDYSGTLKIWRYQDRTDIAGGAPRAADVGPDGSLLLVKDDGKVDLLDPGTYEVARTFEPQDAPCGSNCYLTTAVFSGDGSRVLTYSSSGAVRAWDASSGELLLERGLRRTYRTFWRPSLDGDGGTVAIGGSGEVSAWDASTGKAVVQIEVPEPRIWELALSPEGNRLVTASSKGETARFALRSWEVSSGDLIAERWVDNGKYITYPRHLEISSDGSRAAVVYERSGDWEALVWDLASGDELLIVPSGAMGPDATFSPDGERLASVHDDILTIWDLSKGSPGVQISAPEGLTGPQFSPDGRFVLATEMYGYGVFVWDASTGGPVLALDDVAGTLASFASDNVVVTAAASDERVTLWSCDACGTFDELLALARSRVTRSLTDVERRTYLGESPAPELIH